MKLILFASLIVLLNACSANEQDTSPFHDISITELEPISNLIDAVLVYKSLNDSLPSDFRSIATLSRADWISAGQIKMESRDTIIVGNIDAFSVKESFITKTVTGLQVSFRFNNDSSYWTDYEEALYSKDFDTHFIVEYDILMHIEKGSGSIEMNFDKSIATIQVDTLKGLIWPIYRTGGDSRDIDIINKSFKYEISEPIKLEE